ADKPLIVDARMAWWFIPQAVSVHLTVLPDVGAERAMKRHDERVEQYATKEEALAGLRARAEKERARFMETYQGADTFKLSNYDIVIDSTTASVGDVADEIVRLHYAPQSSNHRPYGMMLSPSTLYPTQGIYELRDLNGDAVADLGRNDYLHWNPIAV